MVIWYVGGVCADVIGWDVVGMLVDLPMLAGNVMMKVVLAGVGVRMAVGNWNGGTCRLDLGGGCGCVQCVGTLGCVGW